MNDYSQLITKMRNEYALLAKENQNLKKSLQQFQNYHNYLDQK